MTPLPDLNDVDFVKLAKYVNEHINKMGDSTLCLLTRTAACITDYLNEDRKDNAYQFFLMDSGNIWAAADILIETGAVK